MSEARAIWQHSRVYGTGIVLNKIAAFLLIPVLLHTLSTEQWGAYALIVLVTEMIVRVFAVISDGMARLYFDFHDEDGRHTVISTTLILFAGLAIVIAAIAVPLAGLINTYLFGHEKFLMAVTVGCLSAVVELLLGIEVYYLRIRKKSLLFVGALLSRSILQFGLSILMVVYLGMGVMGVVLGNAIAVSLISLPIAALIFRQSGFRFSLPVMRQILAISLPLIPAWLASGSFFLVQNWILNALTSTATVGVYSLGTKLNDQISKLVIVPFAAIWGVRLFELGDNSEKAHEFNRVMVYFLVILCSVALGLSLFAREAVMILAAPEFWSAAEIVPVLSVPLVLGTICYHFETAIIQVKKTKFLPIANVGALAAMAGASYFLIPIYGLQGAAASTIMGIVLRGALLTWFAAQCSDYVEYFPWRSVALVAGLAVASFFVGHWLAGDEVDITSILIKLAVLGAFPLIAFYSPVLTRNERASAVGLLAQARSRLLSRGAAS